MSLFAKIMVVVNLILAVVFLAAAGTLLGAAEDYKKKYEDQLRDRTAEKVALDLQITERQAQKDALQRNVAELQTQKAAVVGQLGQLTSSNDATNDANRQLRASYEKLASAQTDLQSRLADLNKQLDTKTSELATSEASRKEGDSKNRAQADEIARLTQDKDTAEKSLAANEASMKSLTDQLDESRTTVERYTKEKGALTGSVSMKDVKGVVQAVDNKVDIYVISVGSKDLVAPGYEFTIYRGNEYISTIVIDKVFPNYSSGTTKRGTKKRDVQAGDEAATRL